MAKHILTIVDTGDLHCGGSTALFPPGGVLLVGGFIAGVLVTAAVAAVVVVQMGGPQ